MAWRLVIRRLRIILQRSRILIDLREMERPIFKTVPRNSDKKSYLKFSNFVWVSGLHARDLVLKKPALKILYKTLEGTLYVIFIVRIDITFSSYLFYFNVQKLKILRRKLARWLWLCGNLETSETISLTFQLFYGKLISRCHFQESNYHVTHMKSRYKIKLKLKYNNKTQLKLLPSILCWLGTQIRRSKRYMYLWLM